MHRAFWGARRTRGIKPETGLICGGWGGLASRRRGGHVRGERALITPRFTRHQHVLRIGAGGDGRLECGQQGGGDNQRLGAAIAQHKSVIARGQQRIDRDGDDAELDRTQKDAGKIDGIQQCHENAVFLPQTQISQGVGSTVHALCQRRVGVAAGIVDISQLGAAPRRQITRDQIVSGVVVTRPGGACGGE